MKTNTARMTDPVSQPKRNVLSGINFSEKDFTASIGSGRGLAGLVEAGGNRNVF
jgi:hypothetical protein